MTDIQTEILHQIVPLNFPIVTEEFIYFHLVFLRRDNYFP
jgi:hypothetical protein